MRVFVAHDPDVDRDFLITVFDDGTGTFATRPGRDQRWMGWSAPTRMRVEATS